ncbi:uncharacterized protein B4U80_09740 [Leptotrombidium deliense]|uniref:Uncharacterized protein n=1 Tax=Leptotrombidium deliense TaxID=299467 RepID=A0A443S667_9ACAR|nr:uncharacterized protein B4U80_09740 [Leptotrombidium deliense]
MFAYCSRYCSDSVGNKGQAFVAPTSDYARDIHVLCSNCDILINYSTDIGWSPYFSIISVVEMGILVSHGPAIAHNLGLPDGAWSEECLSDIEDEIESFIQLEKTTLSKPFVRNSI